MYLQSGVPRYIIYCSFNMKPHCFRIPAYQCWPQALAAIWRNMGFCDVSMFYPPGKIYPGVTLLNLMTTGMCAVCEGNMSPRSQRQTFLLFFTVVERFANVIFKYISIQIYSFGHQVQFDAIVIIDSSNDMARNRLNKIYEMMTTQFTETPQWTVHVIWLHFVANVVIECLTCKTKKA